MPRRDGTGPYGMGPMSGRGFGPCSGYAVSPFIGFGCGYGRGRGYRWMRYGYPVVPQEFEAKDEKEILQAQAQYLESQLESVKKQLEKLEE